MPNAGLKTLLVDALHFAEAQVRRLLEQHPESCPLYTDDGTWCHEKSRRTHPFVGLLPGMMWLFLESGHSHDASFWHKTAPKHSRRLENLKQDSTVCDLGFIFYHGSHKPWLDNAGRGEKPDPKINDILTRAARSLGKRFQQEGSYLASSAGDESISIDGMMNVPLLFHAARESRDESLRDIAHRHCNTTRRHLVRGDGSTAQAGVFDTSTGQFLRNTTRQGYRSDSTWSRGLAWSLYGFITCYELSENIHYLEIAHQNADFYIENTPDGIPPWDYDAPADGPMSRRQPDSSAAAIASVGLLNLWRTDPRSKAAPIYRAFALNSIAAMCRPPYLLDSDEQWEGILRRAVHDMPKRRGVNESTIYGDFFFVEALVKALAAI
jgi:unsaturated chondroitin disaccharide hydrolase